MTLRLLRDARVRHYAGDIVEVSDTEGAFLLATGSAEPVAVTPTKKATATEKKAAKAKG